MSDTSRSASGVTHKVFTVWAALADDREGPWMIWAVDEFSYEVNPDHVEDELRRIKTEMGSGFEFREVTVLVNYDDIAARFAEGETEGTVEDAA